MHSQKIKDILIDIEDSSIHIAGGSVIGMVLSIIDSLICYISNLTIGKKKYENVEKQVKEILKKAYYLKKQSLEVIDNDKLILEKILDAYKNRKEDEDKYQEVLKEAVEFGNEVLNISLKTLSLTNSISEVGNKMLESDFKICMYYAIASIMSSIENIKINLRDINDGEYKKSVEEKCNIIVKKYNF